jgi:predicted Zn finger-like uncharacterized protein
MSAFKITCPHCDAVMKSPKPVPAGKKVKCARCDKVFTTPEEEDDDLVVEAPKKKPSGKSKADPKTATKAADKGAKKKEAKASPPPPPAPPAADEEGGFYGLIEDDKPAAGGDDDDEDEDDERSKQRKKDLEFALDTSIKDPRGPAQAAVIWPSNLLILTGALPFFGYFLLILWMIWPFFFAERVVGPDIVLKWYTSTAPVYKGYEDLTDEERKQVDEAQWAWEVGGISFRITVIIICVIGMVLAGIVAIGGVKMQMLESWGWAMAASIITLLSGSGLGILIGIWCMLVLNDPKVKAGFAYRAE